MCLKNILYLTMLKKARKKSLIRPLYPDLHQKVTGSILGRDTFSVQVCGNPSSSFSVILLTNTQVKTIKMEVVCVWIHRPPEIKAPG